MHQTSGSLKGRCYRLINPTFLKSTSDRECCAQCEREQTEKQETSSILTDSRQKLDGSSTQPPPNADFFLGAHGSYFGLAQKYSLMKEGATTPFVDPDGYKNFIAQKERDFRTELAKQKAAAK